MKALDAYDITCDCLRRALQLKSDFILESTTPLLGGLPEFDSMGVVAVLTCLEESHGVTYEDDEVDVEMFETVETLMQTVAQKIDNFAQKGVDTKV